MNHLITVLRIKVMVFVIQRLQMLLPLQVTRMVLIGEKMELMHIHGISIVVIVKKLGH